MKKKSRFVVGTLVIIGAFGALVASSLKSSTLRSIPVGEIVRADNSQSWDGQRVRVVGWVGADPVKKERVPTANGTSVMNHFTVVDKDGKVRVAYMDALPDTFRVGAPVQVEGVYARSGRMEAEHVLTKCPSKYESENPVTHDKDYAGQSPIAKNQTADKAGAQKASNAAVTGASSYNY